MRNFLIHSTLVSGIRSEIKHIPLRFKIKTTIMTATKRNLVFASVVFAFMCLTLASCSHHTCPTYSKAPEKGVENKG